MTAQARRPFVRLEELLLRHGAITPEQLQKAKEEQARWGGDLGRIFVDLGYISEDLLLRAIAHQMGTRFVDPATEQLDPEIVRALSVQVCEQFGVIAVAGDPRKKLLRIATADPQNAEVLSHLTAMTGFQVEPYVATSASIHIAIRRYFYGEGARDTHPAGFPPVPPDEPPTTPSASAMAPAPDPLPGVISPAAPVDPRPAQVAPSPRAARADAPPPPAGTAELEALAHRVARLESYLGSMQRSLAQQISSDPQIAGLAARLEHLEQVSTNDVGSLRAVVELLLERGVFTLEDLKAKVKAVRERSGAGSGST